MTAHSGALAGEAGAYEALFDAHGVHAVRTLDELADTLELFCAGRRAARGGLAAIHDSGGERAHLIDVAEETGVPLAEISPATRDRLAAVLDPGLPPVNPLDAWGTGTDAAAIYAECMLALLDDPDTAGLAFCVDLTSEAMSQEKYTRMALEVHPRTDKPMAMLSNLASAIDPEDAARVRAAGLPVLEGTASGLRAFGHLFDHRDFRRRPRSVSRRDADPDRARRWRDRLASGVPFAEDEALRLVADYGIPTARTLPARSADEAARAAEEIGWPVVVKTAAAGVAHKTDVGGVRLGVADGAALATAYAELSERLGPAVTVQAAAGPGAELALGIVRDAQFGPLVLVAAGGELVELLADRSLGLPPLDRDRATRMLDRLVVRRLLGGFRGRPAADVEAVVAAMQAISELAEDLGEGLEALDVNPLIAGPDGCVAVDALVVPAAPASAG